MNERYHHDFDSHSAQSASSDDSDDSSVRRSHANLIAGSYQKFSTREALENTIRERQAEIEAAVICGFDIDEETYARAERASEEMRKLLPMRLVIHSAMDLAEMIEGLQTQKESVLRSSLNLYKAQKIQDEIDQLQDQIQKEGQFLLAKGLGETERKGCVEMSVKEKVMVGILNQTKKQCDEGRSSETGKQSVTCVDIDVNNDDNSSTAQSSISSVELPETTLSCGFTNVFEKSWW